MRIDLGKQIRIDKPEPALLDWCKKNLVIANPEYAKKARMHLWLGNTPKTLSLMEWDGETLVLPYGCLKIVDEISDPYFDFFTKSFDWPKLVQFDCEVPLYDYQEEAVEALSKVYCGILQSPAGSGKTQMGIALATKLGLKTLWLTHTRDLLLQSKNRAEQYMSPSLTGTITEGRV